MTKAAAIEWLPVPVRSDDPVAEACGVPVLIFWRRIEADTPCHYCGKPADTRDHVVPRVAGSVGAHWNLVPACQTCNHRKGSRLKIACRCDFCLRAHALFKQGHRVAPRPHKLRNGRRVSKSQLPDSMTIAEKDAYRYGWRRGRVGGSLDAAEAAFLARNINPPRKVFAAFHDGYDDRASGHDFGARPRGEVVDYNGFGEIVR